MLRKPSNSLSSLTYCTPISSAILIISNHSALPPYAMFMGIVACCIFFLGGDLYILLAFTIGWSSSASGWFEHTIFCAELHDTVMVDKMGRSRLPTVQPCGLIRSLPINNSWSWALPYSKHVESVMLCMPTLHKIANSLYIIWYKQMTKWLNGCTNAIMYGYNVL